ncbi:hypothetical protein MKX03_005969 [Papaver bracteatum]|nr:hypothetical protein MKX03_005969 [Papaver bracteatum]
MRTVIQAIDDFPTLVDFVMEILTKLVNKQIWKMPKLWVGFLKCASQTQPHSFCVLLQLPSPQIESTLNMHANLRVGLASHANQPSIRSTLPRSTLAVLGLANEPPPLHAQRSYHLSALHLETGSSRTPAWGNLLAEELLHSAIGPRQSIAANNLVKKAGRRPYVISYNNC